MKIRNASYQDIETITEFQMRMAIETENLQLERELLKKGIAAVLLDNVRGKYLVTEDQGKVVACCMITPEWSDWRCKWVLWLQSVYVDPLYRRKGVFTLMYKHVKKMVFNSNEYSGIRLYVDKNNLNAAKLYCNLGMNSQHYTMFEWMK